MFFFFIHWHRGRRTFRLILISTIWTIFQEKNKYNHLKSHRHGHISTNTNIHQCCKNVCKLFYSDLCWYFFKCAFLYNNFGICFPRTLFFSCHNVPFVFFFASLSLILLKLCLFIHIKHIKCLLADLWKSF